MNLQTVHYLTLVFGSLGAGLPALSAAFPPAASPYLLGGAAVCVLLATVLGVVSPSGAAKGGAQ